MPKIRTAKIFRNGASQAVRLPAEFRINAREVFIWRDRLTGDLVLSKRPGPEVWQKFFELARSAGETEDFMNTRPLNVPFAARSFFKEYEK